MKAPNCVLELRRLRRKSSDPIDTPLTLAVRRCKAGRTWQQVGVVLGVAPSTVRGWLYFPPLRRGRSVLTACRALKALGDLP